MLINQLANLLCCNTSAPRAPNSILVFLINKPPYSEALEEDLSSTKLYKFYLSSLVVKPMQFHFRSLRNKRKYLLEYSNLIKMHAYYIYPGPGLSAKPHIVGDRWLGAER